MQRLGHVSNLCLALLFCKTVSGERSQQKHVCVSVCVCLCVCVCVLHKWQHHTSNRELDRSCGYKVLRLVTCPALHGSQFKFPDNLMQSPRRSISARTCLGQAEHTAYKTRNSTYATTGRRR